MCPMCAVLTIAGVLVIIGLVALRYVRKNKQK